MSETTGNNGVLIRSELWSSSLKEVLQDELMAQGYVNWLSEFPDGTTFTIPSIGESTVRDYTEDTDITYDSLDKGEFQMTITEYVSSAHYITKKARQDLYYASQLEAAFVPSQARAIAEKLETDILDLAGAGASGGQTVDDDNDINGAEHRWVAQGTNEVMTVQDFAKALFALKKANVPSSNLVAIVDPSVEYELNTLTNIVNVSNNPRWEGLITSGIASGMRFAGKCNIFFSAADKSLIPFMGAFRQMPEVDGEYNKDRQREEYVTTARYGLKVYRPENLVVVLSDDDQV